MKKIFTFFIVCFFTSCTNYDVKEVKFEDGSTCSIHKQKKGCDTVYFSTYYKNGNYRSKGSYVGTRIVGIYTEYYPDGKLKRRSLYKGGKIQLPDSDSHAIDIYFGKIEKISNKRRVPLRVSVDGLDPSLYKVFIEDTTNHLIAPLEYGERNKTYKCVNEKGAPLEYEIDESLYNYYIEDLDAHIFYDGDFNCFIICIYYPNALGNKTIEDVKIVNVSNPESWVISDGVFVRKDK